MGSARWPCRWLSQTARHTEFSSAPKLGHFSGKLLVTLLSRGFLSNKDDEPGKLRRGQIGEAVDGGGHDAIWLCSV